MSYSKKYAKGGSQATSETCPCETCGRPCPKVFRQCYKCHSSGETTLRLCRELEGTKLGERMKEKIPSCFGDRITSYRPSEGEPTLDELCHQYNVRFADHTDPHERLKMEMLLRLAHTEIVTEGEQEVPPEVIRMAELKRDRILKSFGITDKLLKIHGSIDKVPLHHYKVAYVKPIPPNPEFQRLTIHQYEPIVATTVVQPVINDPDHSDDCKKYASLIQRLEYFEQGDNLETHYPDWVQFLVEIEPDRLSGHNPVWIETRLNRLRDRGVYYVLSKGKKN